MLRTQRRFLTLTPAGCATNLALPLLLLEPAQLKGNRFMLQAASFRLEIFLNRQLDLLCPLLEAIFQLPPYTNTYSISGDLD